MSLGETFLWGFGGSAAVEVLALVQVFYRDPIDVPERYKRVGFWIVRFLLAIMAGGLVVAYGIEKPLLAVNTGAATPLIIQALAQGLRPPSVPTR